jgi:hypothetical protein
MKSARGVIDTEWTMHAVSLTRHVTYDTACTIDQRFERPWQPLKRISLKNHICSRLVLPHHYHWHRMNEIRRFKSQISSRIPCKIKKGLSTWIRGQGGGECLMKKTEGRKSRDTVPLPKCVARHQFLHCSVNTVNISLLRKDKNRSRFTRLCQPVLRTYVLYSKQAL